MLSTISKLSMYRCKCIPCTLAIVCMHAYVRNSSQKRPKTSSMQSNSSILTYETIPADVHSEERVEPQIREDSIKRHGRESETNGKQTVSTEGIPVYEVQYEPVKISGGLGVIQEEKMDLTVPTQSEAGDVGRRRALGTRNTRYENVTVALSPDVCIVRPCNTGQLYVLKGHILSLPNAESSCPLL